MTQEALAEKSGFSQQYLSGLDAASATPPSSVSAKSPRHSGLAIWTWFAHRAGVIAAPARGVNVSEICKVCPKRDDCGYRRQRQQSGRYWLLSHQMLFTSKPSAIPTLAFVVIDEKFFDAALVEMLASPYRRSKAICRTFPTQVIAFCFRLPAMLC